MKTTTVAILAAALFAVAHCDKKGAYLNDARQTQADRAKRHGYGGGLGGAAGVVHGGGHGGGYGGGGGLVSSLAAGSSSVEHGGYGGAVGGFGVHGHAGHGTLYRAVVERPRFEYSRGYAKSTSSGIVSGHPSPAKYTYGGSFVGQSHYRPQYYYRPSHSVYHQQQPAYGAGSSGFGGFGHAGRGYGGHGGLAGVGVGLGHGHGGYGGAVGGGYGHGLVADDSVEAGGYGAGHGHGGLVGGNHVVGGSYGVGGGFGGSGVGHHGGHY